MEQKIRRWMQEHREEMAEDILRLLKIISVSRPEEEPPYGSPCREALEEMLRIGARHGFSGKNYQGHCGALWLEGREEDAQQCIGLWGHLDVVPLGNHWIFPPEKPLLKDGYLIGRGAEDNKGPLIASLYAVKCLKELGVDTPYPLRVFFGCDEERGMEDVEYYASHYPCPKLSIVTDCGFPVCYGEKGILEIWLESSRPFSRDVLEITAGNASNMIPDQAFLRLWKTPRVQEGISRLPEGFAVTEDTMEDPENPGKCLECFGIRAFGVSAHAAFPQGGQNALVLLANGVLQAGLLEKEDQALLRFIAEAGESTEGRGLGIACQDEESGALTCAASLCHKEENGRLRLHFNIRYPVTVSSTWILQQITSLAEPLGFSLAHVRDSAPNHFPKEHPAVRILTETYNRITGEQREPYTMGGGTYARKLPRALAFGPSFPGREKDSALFPPGHGGGHQPDEALLLDDLLEAAVILCMGLIGLEKEQW